MKAWIPVTIFAGAAVAAALTGGFGMDGSSAKDPPSPPQFPLVQDGASQCAMQTTWASSLIPAQLSGALGEVRRDAGKHPPDWFRLTGTDADDLEAAAGAGSGAAPPVLAADGYWEAAMTALLNAADGLQAGPASFGQVSNSLANANRLVNLSQDVIVQKCGTGT